MHIVLLAPDLKGHSGWSRYAADLGAALACRGNRITAIVSQETGVPWCREVPFFTGDTAYVGRPLRCLLDGLRLRRLMRTLKPDIIHCMAEPYALLLPLLGGEWPACMTAHATYAALPLRMGRVTGWLMRRAYRRLQCIFAVSAFTVRFIRAADPSFFEQNDLEGKIAVVPNAIDLSRAEYPRKRLPDDGERCIVSVGAVKPRKGHLQAIEACALFLRDHPTALRYDILGSLEQDGEYVALLRKRIRELKLEQVVHLKGIVDDAELARAYAQADLLLLLSLQEGFHAEGFGLVFLEANAWGVPVIGPTTGGCPEAIDEGRSGYVCDPKDTALVAKRIGAILIDRTIDPADCRRWAEAHSVESAAERVQEHYTLLLSGAR